MFPAIYKLFHRHYHARYHGIYRHAKQLFVFDLALLGLALGLLGTSLFFWFWRPGITDLIELKISLGDERAQSGDSVRLTIDYANRSKFKLDAVTLGVHLPDGFVVDRARTPKEVFSDQSLFALPDIAPGAKGRAELYGRLWAAPQTTERFLALLSYTPTGNATAEQKAVSFLATPAASVLASEFKIATSSFPGQPLAWTFTLRNNSSEAITGISLLSDWPVSLFKENDAKNISLQAHESRVWNGAIMAPAKIGTYLLTITPTVLAGNFVFPQGRQVAELRVFNPNLAAAARFPAPPRYLSAGDEIPVEISWKNSGELNLINTRLRLECTIGTVDLRATARDNNLKVAGAALVADAGNRTELAGGKKDRGGSFTVILKLLPSFSLGGAENAALIVRPIYEAEAVDIPGQTFSQTGDSASLPLATELTLRGETRYYTEEGDQLGRGPLPPEVGATTKYWIMARVANGTNAARDARFETTLAPDVEFTGKQSVTIGPQLNYDPADKKVSWQYRSLPANSFTGLYFEVAITPAAKQIGKTVSLTTNLLFSAVDDAVGKEFHLLAPGLANILPASDQGSARGAAVVAK